MSKNNELTPREFAIETSINSEYSRDNVYISLKDGYEVEEYVLENIWKLQGELHENESLIDQYRSRLKEYPDSEYILNQIEIHTFRKEKCVQKTRKLFDKIPADQYFEYLQQTYQNAKLACGTGTMNLFFDKIESENANN